MNSPFKTVPFYLTKLFSTFYHFQALRFDPIAWNTRYIAEVRLAHSDANVRRIFYANIAIIIHIPEAQLLPTHTEHSNFPNNNRLSQHSQQTQRHRVLKRHFHIFQLRILHYTVTANGVVRIKQRKISCYSIFSLH